MEYFGFGLAVQQLNPSTENNGMGDIVGIWEVNLSDGLHRIEFEHGTASGKRIIRVDGKVPNISALGKQNVVLRLNLSVDFLMNTV